MEKVINKIKPVFLLFGISFVAISTTWAVNQLRLSSNVFPSQEQVLEESIYTIEEVEAYTIEDTTVPSEVKFEEKETEEDVLGVTGGVFICGGGDFTEIESTSTCQMEASVGIKYTEDMGAFEIGAGLVAVDADIVLAKVTVPLELLSGVEVADTNRQITSQTPTLKPAGEQISEKTANILLPPGQQIDEYKEWDSDKPFSFDYITAFFEKSDSPSEENKMGVETELKNKCAEYDNASNVNPDKSNTISEFMYDSVYRYPGEKDNITEEEVIEECSDSDTYTQWSGEYNACRLNYVATKIQQVHRITDWYTLLTTFLKCKFADANDPECIYPEDIVVIMESPFGSDKDCIEGTACTNAFMKRRAEVVLAPGSDLGGKQYYLTPCQAFVEGRATEVTISCAWDMSHLFKERKFNEYDDVPSIDSTPTDEEYKEFLREKVEGQRGEDIIIQESN